MRLLHTFKSQDHAQAAKQAVSCMNHHFDLLMKDGQSRFDRVKSFKTKPLVQNAGASFGLMPFNAKFIDYVEYNIDV